MTIDELYLPLLPPPVLPSEETAESDLYLYYLSYRQSFRVSDTGSAAIAIEVLEPEPRPETVTVVTPQPGTVTWLPAGTAQPLPDGSPVLEDTLVLAVYPAEATYLQTALPGRPLPASWAFTGIDPVTVEAQARAWAQAAPDLQLGLNESGDPDDRATAEALWVERFMRGEVDAPQEAGTTAGTLLATQLVVSLFDLDDAPIHPALLLGAFDEANPLLKDHPLVAGVDALSIDVAIHLRFRYFKVENSGPSKGDFAWLAGATVEVRDADPLVDDVIDTGVTDADGRVTFYVSNWDWSGTADLYFRVTIDEPNAVLVQHARHTKWHGSWSTWKPPTLDGAGGLGVTALDGVTRGYFPDYAGWTIGTPLAPLEFNLGTPVFAAVTYLALKDPANVSAWRKAPRGLELNLASWWAVVDPEDGTIGEEYRSADTFYADEDGEVWGTAFGTELGRRHEVALSLAIAEDATANFLDSIEMPRFQTIGYPAAWQGSERDPNNLYWERFDVAAIGDPASIRVVKVDHQPDDDVAATLYTLKTIRDTHLWFREVTSGDWKGQEYCWGLLIPASITQAFTDVREFMLAYFPAAIPVLPSSNWPQLGLMLHQRDKWSRDTIAHEFAHSVMWAIASVDLSDLACALVVGDYYSHDLWKEFTEFAALIEGWSDMVAHALGATGGYELPTSKAWVEDAAGNGILLNSVPGIGRRIEGCLAAALWFYLEREWGLRRVVDSDSKDLQEADPGGGTRLNTSFAGASLAFLKTIWEPAQAMQDTWPGYPGTMDFLGEVEESMEESNWIVLDTEYLHVWNIT